MTRRCTLAPLAISFPINLMSYFDRQILGAAGEQIRQQWALRDTALWTLGVAFTLFDAAAEGYCGFRAE